MRCRQRSYINGGRLFLVFVLLERIGKFSESRLSYFEFSRRAQGPAKLFTVPYKRGKHILSRMCCAYV